MSRSAPTAVIFSGFFLLGNLIILWGLLLPDMAALWGCRQPSVAYFLV